jgi:hypothetical protein
VAYLALVEFLARNGVDWSPPSADETVTLIERVAAGKVSGGTRRLVAEDELVTD